MGKARENPLANQLLGSSEKPLPKKPKDTKLNENPLTNQYGLGSSEKPPPKKPKDVKLNENPLANQYGFN
jgi:hypothetical protein